MHDQHGKARRLRYCTAEEGVQRTEMKTDALSRVAHHARDPFPSSDTLLPLAPRETAKIVQNQLMPVEGSDTPQRALTSSRGKRLSNSSDKPRVISVR